MISIILPAKNEAAALADLLPRLRRAQPDAEIIVVDDGSTDDTAALCARHVGASRAPGLFDGQRRRHQARRARRARATRWSSWTPTASTIRLLIERLLQRLSEGFDMVVGARDWAGQAGVGRGVANTIYNWLASRMTGFPVLDLTSGFRAVDAAKFREFVHLLPNGFSYPTTITMAFFRSAYAVAYEPIPVARRIGKSHIRPIARWNPLSADHLQDRDAVFAAEAVRAGERDLLPAWARPTTSTRSSRCTGSRT